MKNIIQMLKNIFKIAKLLSVDDSENLRFGSVSTLGKTQKVLIFSPYGLMHKPPADSMVLLWSQQGQESNGIGIADDPRNRTLKDLSEGEVALGNYSTSHYIYFDKDGLCTIVSKDLKITVDDSVEIVGTDVEITSSTLTHNGTNIGDSHIHSQGADSDGDSEVDTGGPHS